MQEYHIAASKRRTKNQSAITSMDIC